MLQDEAPGARSSFAPEIIREPEQTPKVTSMLVSA
jgi:hypothetical protein